MVKIEKHNLYNEVIDTLESKWMWLEANDFEFGNKYTNQYDGQYNILRVLGLEDDFINYLKDTKPELWDKEVNQAYEILAKMGIRA